MLINHAALPARSPAGHQADFEWERDQGQKLMAEFLKMIAVTMTANEATARLEGELAALKARPWWRRLPVVSHNGMASTRRKGVKPFDFFSVSQRFRETPIATDSTRQTQAVGERAA